MKLLAQETVIVYRSKMEQAQDEFIQMVFQYIYDHGMLFLAMVVIIIIMGLLIRAVNRRKY